MSHSLGLYGQWLRRDLSQRFAGSAAGRLWLLLQPLGFIAVITLVFNGFFKAKWPGGDGSALNYGLQVFVGLALHTAVAEVLNRCPSSILAHPYLVTKVRFPLVMLPMVTLGVASAQLALSLVLAMAAALLAGVVAPVQAVASWWALPVLLLPSLALMAGLAWGLAAFGTYLRDLGNLMPAISSLLMFLMPVFYPAEVVPPSMAWFIDANPLAFTIESLRALIFQGALPPLGTWALHGALGLVVMGVGWWCFARVQPGFADVL
jgi:lipopolysaccharide transport system permease protein